MTSLLENIWRDLQHAARLLRRMRGFTVTAIAVLAICIGANSAVFSVISSLLLRPLPYPDADRIVHAIVTSKTGYSLDTSVPKFVGWRDGAKAFGGSADGGNSLEIFEAFAAYQAADPGVNLLGGDNPVHLSALHVSSTYFDVFGAKMMVGRGFRSLEDLPHGPHVIVLSDGLWARSFGRDPGVVGRMLPLGGDAYEVVGVLAGEFQADPAVDVYLPLQLDTFSLDFANVIRVVGRLRPSATVAKASGYLSGIAPLFRQKFPLSMGPWEDFAVIPLRDALVGDVRPALRMLSGAVVFVLLIGCANVATLLLARGQRRRREIATRTALGAQRSRIIRQLLTESALLALSGGILGLAAGVIGLRAIVRLGSDVIPTLARASGPIILDPQVVWFTAGVSLMTGVLFGVLPALSSSRVDLSAAFKEAGTAGDAGWHRHRLQTALVTLEMTLAIVLLIGCGLMVRTLAALRDVDRGFDPGRVVALETSLSGAGFQRTAELATAVRNARQRLDALPGIAAFAAARALPLEPGFALPFTIARRPVNAPFEGTVGWRSVSPGYFDVFRIPVLRGRSFTDHDDQDGLPVVVVNAALVRKYWQRNDPVGEVLTIGTGAGPEFVDVPRRIVGVVADPRDTEANRDPGPMVYVPLAQVSDAMTARNNRLFPLTWAIRTEIEPRLMTTPLERELRGATNGLPIARIRTMAEIVAGPAKRAAFNVTLLSVFGGVALLMAVIGFYGLMSYSVQQRTQEIGIRMALGAVPSDVRNMVLLQGLRVAAFGVAFGVGAALLLTRVMETLVFGVKTYDPAVFAGVALLLSVIALVAALIPAHRATRVNPLDAVRGM
jgi:putative ABC transport system permease protein